MHVIVWLPGLSYSLFARRIELGLTHCNQIRAAVELLGHCPKQIRCCAAAFASKGTAWRISTGIGQRSTKVMKTQAGPLLLVLLTLVLGLPLAQGAAGDGAERSYFLDPAFAAATPGPFSAAIRTGNTLYLGGHLGIDPHTGRAPPDGAVEARLLMDGMQRTLKAAGLKMDDLVYVTVISTDLSRNETFDAIYRTYFHGHYPARGLLGVSALQQGAHFEVLGVAVKPARLQL